MTYHKQIKKLSLKNQRLNKYKIYPQGQIKRHRVTSKYLNNTRTIDIYLPPGYRHHPRKRFPVLYMHDGNNLFFPEIAFGNWPWFVDKTLDKLIAHHLVQELIVVGIYNTPQRHDEYAWSPMRFRHHVEGGKGPQYGHFLVEELKPLIDHKYRTLPSAEHTGVMGASMGGLISFYLGMHWPHVFSKVALVSPSLWWNWGEPIRDARHYPHGLKVWLDMGTQEGHNRQGVKNNSNLRYLKLLKQALLQRGYFEGHNLAYFEDRGGKHNEYFWGNRFHLTMIYFWGTQPHLIWKTS